MRHDTANPERDFLVEVRLGTLARLEGLEPPTLGLEGPCSIQLSYRRVAASIVADHTPEDVIRARTIRGAGDGEAVASTRLHRSAQTFDDLSIR